MSETAFDFKKEYKDLYQPKDRPVVIEVPAMPFIMVDGTGDPNNNPEFEQAIDLLYGLSFAIKMSKMKGNQPDGYFDYVVPPLEGLWWVDDGVFSLTVRDNWLWTLMIRQPDFVTDPFFEWACSELKRKKPELPVDIARLVTFQEGLCIQILHPGPYATELESMKKIDALMSAEGLKSRLESGGKHHEIYLSDPRKGDPEKMRTVLRHPVASMQAE